MSAEPETSSVSALPKTLGIVAGGGSLPTLLAKACTENNIKTQIVGLKGFVQEGLSNNCFRVGQAGYIVQHFKDHGIQDLVLIGQITRPSIWTMRPDWKTFLFYLKLGFRRLGDNSLLSALRKELEHDGFKVHGIHKFLPDLLAPKGVLGNIKPNKLQQEDIAFGFKASQTLGLKDKGQAVIVQDKKLIDEEDKKGTRALITRNSSGILVKSCKPQQDRDLDLPTIGPDTVRQAVSAGLQGIAVQAGKSLITDRKEVIELADHHGLFVVGIDG